MQCRNCKFWKPDQERENSMRGYCANPSADKSGVRTVFDYSCRYFDFVAVASDGAIILSDEVVKGWIQEIPTYQGYVDRLPVTSTAKLFLTIALTVMQAALEEVQKLREENRGLTPHAPDAASQPCKHGYPSNNECPICGACAEPAAPVM